VGGRGCQGEIPSLFDVVSEEAEERRADSLFCARTQAEISRLRDELDSEREAREELLGDQDELRNQLRDAQDMLEEAQDDLARLREDGRDDRSPARGDDSGAFGDGRRGRDKEARREIEKLDRKVADLEQVRFFLSLLLEGGRGDLF
jgi:DNA repair exonuclease SbcCD ATPase subunit